MIADTLRYTWSGSGQSFVLSGTLSWSTPISTFDCDEVVLVVTSDYADAAAFDMRVQWASDPGAGSLAWSDDSFVTTSQANGVNSVLFFLNEWNYKIVINQTGQNAPVAIPAMAHFMRVGFYIPTFVVNPATQIITLAVERQRTGATQP